MKLNDKLLKKYGFEFKPEGEELWEQIWTRQPENGYAVRIWEHADGFCLECFDNAPLETLKHLKNIYLALTGEVLTKL